MHNFDVEMLACDGTAYSVYLKL